MAKEKLYIAYISHGKDSLAMLEAIKILGYPLDKIVSVDVWATKEIRGELPEMVAFKEKADRIIFERYGVPVTHIAAELPFEEYFYKIRESGKNIGANYGWPLTKTSWCNGRLKLKPMEHFESGYDVYKYVGIAADEESRIASQRKNKKSILPLVDLGWTEQDCYDFCERHDLLSPTYTTSFRDGCWFCPQQSLDSLRSLRKNYPEYWELMKKWDKDSSTCFTSRKRTLHDYDKRFALEDLGKVPLDRKFRWKMLELSLDQ